MNVNEHRHCWDFLSQVISTFKVARRAEYAWVYPSFCLLFQSSSLFKACGDWPAVSGWIGRCYRFIVHRCFRTHWEHSAYITNTDNQPHGTCWSNHSWSGEDWPTYGRATHVLHVRAPRVDTHVTWTNNEIMQMKRAVSHCQQKDKAGCEIEREQTEFVKPKPLTKGGIQPVQANYQMSYAIESPTKVVRNRCSRQPSHSVSRCRFSSAHNSRITQC